MGPHFEENKFFLFDVTSPQNAKLVNEIELSSYNNPNPNLTAGIIVDEIKGLVYLMNTNNNIQAFEIRSLFGFEEISIIEGGIFPYNKIRSTTDGQIFTANLAINGETRIYRWADETSEPELVFSDSLGGRLGDSIGLVGEDHNVKILLSGSGAEKIEHFTYNGEYAYHDRTYNIPAGAARGGFSNNIINNKIVITGTGTAPTMIDISSGELFPITSNISASDFNSVMNSDQFIFNGKHYVVLGPAFTNGRYYIFELNNEGIALLVKSFGPIGENANLTNSGGVIFDDINDRLYVMDTNNAIESYPISEFLPTSVISGGIFPFNQIKATLDGQIFTANLAINGESRIYRWADEMAEPELVYAGSLGGRLGDSFGVVGEGQGVRVLLSGSGADKVEAFDWDGVELTHAATFHIAAGEARGGFSSHVFEDSVLISGTNTVPRFMNINDGGLGQSLSAMGDRNMTNDILKRGDKSFAVLGPNFGSNYEFRLFDFSDKNNVKSINTFNLGQDQNLNNTGGVIFDEINDRIYLMNTNNSIKAFNISDFIDYTESDNPYWTHDSNFQAHRDSIQNVHGVAVDPDGKVWVQPFYATEPIVMNRDVGADGVTDTLLSRAIYIYNPDGTQTSFSPLKFIDYGDGKVDTLGYVWYPDESDNTDGGSYEGYSGRGITADASGNIIISAYNRLYKVDYTDGSGIAMVDPSAGCSLTEATTDEANNVYVGCVVGSAGPLVKFAPDLTGEEALVTIPGSFSRDLQVSGDGNTIWWAGWTNGSVHRFSRDDEFSSFGDADTVLRGIKAEVFDIHPITGHLWVGSGSLNDIPADPYEPQRWYAFDVNNLEGSPTPLDTIAWVADPNIKFNGNPGFYDGTYDQARPRALDFSPDGKTAYIGAFATDNGFQRFTKGDVTVPPPPTDTRKRIDMIVNMKYQELLGNFKNNPSDSIQSYVGVYGNFNDWEAGNYVGLSAINDSVFTAEIRLDTTVHSELQYRFVMASSSNGIIDIEDNDPVIGSDGEQMVEYRWLEVDPSSGLQSAPTVYFGDIGPAEYRLQSLPLATIQEAREQQLGTKVMIEGVVTRVTYNFVYIQDGSAGMLLFSRPWHSDLNSIGFNEAATNGDIKVGDRLKVAGVLTEYNGTLEVVNLAGWKIISEDNDLLYSTIESFNEINSNGESYENELVQMNNLRFITMDSTYARKAYQVMTTTDGSVGYIFMAEKNNNDWYGEPFTSKPFTFKGVVRQILSEGELIYALMPHDREDLVFAGLNNKNMYLSTSYTKEGFKFSSTVNLDNLNTVDSLMSYQFNLKVPEGIRYDSLKVKHPESSPLLVSNYRDSVLRVAITGSGFISNHHPLLELFFLAEEVGSYSLDLSEVKLNEIRLDEFYSGIVRVDPFRLGDVDDSGEIDAYDAGIVLHQTVGSQIIKPDLVPSWDEGPWFNWRFGAADVDGDGELLAIDATQILKYVVGLIDDFTVTPPPVESVFIEPTSDGLIVNAPEGIEGLNILLPEVEGISYSDPEITWENAASALSKEEGMKIALASTDPKSGEVLKIPYMIGADDRQTIQIISYTNGKRMVHEVQLRGVNVTAENEMGLPEKYSLSQNYPNPFNPTTKIQYALPKAGNVRIDIYSMLGQKVATLVDTHQPAGYHTANFDASQLSSGVYLYNLSTPGFSQTKKMLLIK
jgi:hypothetical protein